MNPETKIMYIKRELSRMNPPIKQSAKNCLYHIQDIINTFDEEATTKSSLSQSKKKNG